MAADHEADESTLLGPYVATLAADGATLRAYLARASEILVPAHDACELNFCCHPECNIASADVSACDVTYCVVSAIQRYVEGNLMAHPESPVVQRRRLRAELKRARKQAGLTQKEAADLLAWHPSKLIRIEGGTTPIAIEDLIGLLNRYGVTDRAQVDELVEVAHVSRRPSWWDKYREAITPTHYAFLEYEASAVRIRTFQALLIPGLLQTREYSDAVMRVYTPDEESIKRGMKIRGTRKEQLLESEAGPEMFFILDEAAIQRHVGGPVVMREQLLWLEELNKRPNIRIQVVRFSKGAHPGMRGAFTVFEVPFEDEDYAVLLEHPHGDDLIQNDTEKVSSYLDTFFVLEALASAEDDLHQILRPLIDNLLRSDTPPTD